MEIDVSEEKDTVSMEIEVKQQPSEISVTEIHVAKDEESTLTFEVEGQIKPGQ